MSTSAPRAPSPAGLTLPEPISIGALARQFGCAVDARLEAVVVRRIVEPSPDATEDALVFVANARAAIASPAVAICAPEHRERLASERCVLHEKPLWVLASLLHDVETRAEALPGPAQIDPSAELRSGAVVQPGAVVGPGCVIEENAVIYRGARLGRNVRVGAGAVIGRPGFGFVLGPAGAAKRMPQLGGVVIDDDVELGPLCTVDAGTLTPTHVGRGSKLDAHVHVGHNVQIGRGCLIAAQAGFAGSVVLGDGVQVGGQAGFKDHVRVGAGCTIAAKSGVIGDIPPGAVVAGFPAVEKGRWLRAMAELLHGKRQR
jgi:UDP-3-O-[3-hydroxymyristoyl] glucosamine N-acyltransferase